jgi:hypothetical protein
MGMASGRGAEIPTGMTELLGQRWRTCCGLPSTSHSVKPPAPRWRSRSVTIGLEVFLVGLQVCGAIPDDEQFAAPKPDRRAARQTAQRSGAGQFAQQARHVEPGVVRFDRRALERRPQARVANQRNEGRRFAVAAPRRALGRRQGLHAVDPTRFVRRAVSRRWQAVMANKGARRGARAALRQVAGAGPTTTRAPTGEMMPEMVATTG